MSFVGSAAVLAVAFAFVVAAGGKFGARTQFERTIRRLSPQASDRTVRAAAVLVPAVEILVAFWLLVGARHRAAIIATLCLLAAFSVVLLVAEWRERRPIDCHCFGNLLPSRWQHGLSAQARNGALALLAVTGLAARDQPIPSTLALILAGCVVAIAWAASRRSAAPKVPG